MSDKEARATGAGDSIEVDGKTWHLAPLRMAQLHKIQRKALASYRSSYLQTFADNAKLLGDAGDGLLASKLEEVAKWDVSDLPTKFAHSCELVTVTKELVSLVVTAFEMNADESEKVRKNERRIRQLSSVLLDNGMLTIEQVTAATNTTPRRVRAEYDMWWATATHEGRSITLLSSLERHHPQVTQQDIQDWPLPSIVEAVSIIERLTAPAVGNI